MMFAVAACGDVVARTQVMVFVDAEPGVRSQTDSVEIVVRGGTGASAQWQERLDRTLAIDDETTWPFSIALIPLKDDAARVYEFTATARSATGDAVGRVRAISGYRRSKTLELRLLLEDDCQSQVAACGSSQTCRGGACVDATVDVTSLDPLKPTNAGPSDGGTSDADAPPDAEPEDTSVPDTSVPDAEIPDTAPPEPPGWCGLCAGDDEKDNCGEGLSCVNFRVTWLCQVRCECERSDVSRCPIRCDNPGEVCIDIQDVYVNSEGNVMKIGICASPEYVEPLTEDWPMPLLRTTALENTCLSMQ